MPNTWIGKLAIVAVVALGGVAGMWAAEAIVAGFHAIVR